MLSVVPRPFRRLFVLGYTEGASSLRLKGAGGGTPLKHFGRAMGLRWGIVIYGGIVSTASGLCLRRLRAEMGRKLIRAEKELSRSLFRILYVVGDEIW